MDMSFQQVCHPMAMSCISIEHHPRRLGSSWVSPGRFTRSFWRWNLGCFSGGVQKPWHESPQMSLTWRVSGRVDLQEPSQHPFQRDLQPVWQPKDTFEQFLNVQSLGWRTFGLRRVFRALWRQRRWQKICLVLSWYSSHFQGTKRPSALVWMVVKQLLQAQYGW